ncbi:MAG: hypothetical protein GTN62_08690 [Gemmatimonadales bacterium]|nr:hypothetical protein [Gemmatimonadales bacterium]NIN50174.1 hypothetical protein [Gemmatimonadales bacterium]NIP07638.1 hypothetical protein [Gemmatimonadales bacterium]NIR01790.1 hypothetical protein [Gemmatimonadales bacterium]NIS65693.1 hypothetical protein [Gemmatimonadales bacterium]
MTRISLSQFRLGAVAASLLTAATACGGGLGLPSPVFENIVDTTTLFALQGTAITSPSAFDVVSGRRTRTQLAEPFDFAFDIDETGKPILLPREVLGLRTAAGILLADTPFNSVLRAPTEDYITDSAIPIEEETTFVARSRAASQTCSFLGALPRYGKFRVLTLDPQQRTVTLELLVNRNCGYRDLEPGLPTS